MKLTRSQIYIIAAFLGITIGAIVGRYIYLNNAEETEAVGNLTPDVEQQITNGK